MRTRGDENLNTLCKHNKNLRRVIDDLSKFFFLLKRRLKLNCLFNDGESRPLSSPFTLSRILVLKCPCVNFIYFLTRIYASFKSNFFSPNFFAVCVDSYTNKNKKQQ